MIRRAKTFYERWDLRHSVYRFDQLRDSQPDLAEAPDAVAAGAAEQESAPSPTADAPQDVYANAPIRCYGDPRDIYLA